MANHLKWITNLGKKLYAVHIDYNLYTVITIGLSLHELFMVECLRRGSLALHLCSHVPSTGVKLNMDPIEYGPGGPYSIGFYPWNMDPPMENGPPPFLP